MMAVAGTFLVFPVELPHSYGTAFALMGLVVAAAVVAAANCLGVRETRRDGASVLMFAAVAAGSSACVIAAIAAALPRYATAGSPLDVWALLDLIGLGLLFWLMRHMSAVQMTTRFLIAPLLANLIIVILLRPHIEVQSWIGLVLIAQGAGWMVFGHADSNAAHGKTLGLE
jgi:drug/metabolite transporter (DMT)-like permease